MFWKILGIEPTKDKKKITRAYREKLVNTNPEEKPEEFKELRNAYEEALKYAEDQGLRTEKTPVESWRDRLEALYNDFPSRNDVECWARLINEDVCQSIDTRIGCEEAMMNFFMDHYFISHEVWVYLDSQFSLLERTEELYEKYPKDFIDFVIVNGIIHGDTLPMKMFYPGKDGEMCHKYLGLYLKIRRESNEDSRSLIEEMLALPESHPYGDALALSYRINFEDKRLISELKQLCDKYPDDIHLGLLMANELFQQEFYRECSEQCSRFLEIDPAHQQFKWIYAHSLAKQGKYEDAITQLNELMRAAGGNSQTIADLNQTRQKWNVEVIEQKKHLLEEHPDDAEAIRDLAWAYLENEMIDEARKLTERLPKDSIEPFDYYNLMSNICFATERKEEGMAHLDSLIEVIKALPDDGDEKTQKRKARLGEMYGRKGYYYYTEFKQMDKAMEAYENALNTDNNRADTLTQLVQISLSEKDYEKAVEYGKRLTKESPDSYHGHLLLAYGYFYLHQDRDAYDSINRAMDLNRSDLSTYILKIRILIRNNAFDEAQQIIQFLLDSNLQEDGSVLFCQGLMAELRDSNYDEAIRLYEDSIKALGDNLSNFSFSDELVYRLLCLRGEKLNGNIKEDRDIMMELAEKGLKCNPKHRGLMDYKAWLLSKEKKYEESLAIYMELAEAKNHPASVDAHIGYIYYQDLEHKADLSRQYYLKSLENNGDYNGYFYAGMCSMYMGELDKAEEYFLKLQKHEPDMLDSYFRLSFVYEMKNKLDKALENINQVIKIVDLNKNDNTRYYYQKVMILRRLKRWDEAVRVIKDMITKFNYSYGNKLIFETYLQGGLFDKAREWMNNWKKTRPQPGEYFDRIVTMNILENSFFKAQLNRSSYATKMNRKRALELDHLINAGSLDFNREIKILEKMLAEEEKGKREDLTKITGNLAYAYFHRGNREKQILYAERTLKELEPLILEYGVNGLLYQTRKARALALAGKIREAFELIEELKYHSLCESCPYCACKDLDAFEMEVREIAGDMGLAYQLSMAGRNKWPDEESFVIMSNILKKKAR